MKPDTVNIIQITAGPGGAMVYGLGDDGNVYTWNAADGGWILHVLE